jgi:hypothetical protein
VSVCGREVLKAPLSPAAGRPNDHVRRDVALAEWAGHPTRIAPKAAPSGEHETDYAKLPDLAALAREAPPLQLRHEVVSARLPRLKRANPLLSRLRPTNL